MRIKEVPDFHFGDLHRPLAPVSGDVQLDEHALAHLFPDHLAIGLYGEPFGLQLRFHRGPAAEALLHRRKTALKLILHPVVVDCE